MKMPLLMMMARSNTVSSVVRNHMEVRPTPAQYAMQVGDVGFVLNSGSDVDNCLQIIKILEPDSCPDRVPPDYPDWEDNVRNDYLLCAWRAADDRSECIGWFSRCAIVPLAPEEYQDLNEKMDDPSWHYSDEGEPFLDVAYRRYHSDSIPINNPDGEPLLCEECSSPQVVISIHHIHMAKINGMRETRNGVTKLVKISPDSETCIAKYRLMCKDCGWDKPVEEDGVWDNPLGH
jgi:hypothetical protein